MTDATCRADHITPDTLGKKVLLTTTGGASLMGVVTAYKVTAETETLALFSQVMRVTTSTYVDFRMEGVDNEVTIRGDAELRVLA